MSRDNWFFHFERIDAEHPELSDDEKCEMALEAQRDEFADRADMINDERWIDERIKK